MARLGGGGAGDPNRSVLWGWSLAPHIPIIGKGLSGMATGEGSVTSNRAVPYCTVKGFRRALEVLRQDAPERVDRSSLVDRGLSPHAVYPVLGALRYLGLVNASDRVQPSLQAFLDDDDVDGRRAVIEEAYAEILPTLDFPVDDREVVDEILISKHGCAAGVAAFCSTFLLWLAAESGLPVARMDRSRRGRPPAYLAQLSDAARERLSSQSIGEIPRAFGAGEAPEVQVTETRDPAALPGPLPS